MWNSSRRTWLPLAMVGLLMALLVVLGTLQYLWIGRLSRAERERLWAGLDEAASRFTEGFDRELIRLVVTFTPVEHRVRGEAEEWLVDRLEWWRAEAPFPGLVADLILVRQTAEDLTVRCLDEATERFEPCPFPSTFASIRADLAAGTVVPPLPDGAPVLVLTPRHRGDAPRIRPGEGQNLFVLLELDLKYATQTVLPRLAAGSLGEAAQDFTAVVVAAADPTTVLFRHGSGLGAVSPGDADVVRPFFPIRPLVPPVGRGRMLPDRIGGDRAASVRPAEPDTKAGDARPGDYQHGMSPGRWLLLIRHRAGSLELAVSLARRRNLAVVVSVLSLLAASSILLAVSSQRAQRLARQQLQFVAGVSHELRTPLTAITAAGQNLADGVVTDPDQVRRYGAMIEQEGNRLAQMVGRVLTFAGIRSGQRAYAVTPVEVPSIVASVLADARLALESRGFTVETDIPSDLPQVLADAEAMREALGNLVDNAIKFSLADRWLALRARSVVTARGKEVAISVADRGPGIPRTDLPRVFEPFVRGAAAFAPGSGLGLSVVKHVVDGHEGRITVASEPGRGTTITIYLAAVQGALEAR